MVERVVTATDREIARTYDGLASVYDAVVARWEEPTYAQAVYALAPQPDERILDVGCGPGAVLASVAEAVGPTGAVYGLDVAERMLDRAASRLAGVGTPSALVRGDARELPVATDSLDAVVMTETLELFSAADARTVLAEIQRVLRAGGRLVVTSMERAGFEDAPFVRAYEWVYAHLPGYDRVGCRPIDVVGTLTDTGFAVVESETVLRGGVWPTTIALARP